MKTYIGTKIIKAEPMDECLFKMNMDPTQDLSKQETREGYKVIYSDGYISWSPKKQFEEAYREVSNQEKELLK